MPEWYSIVSAAHYYGVAPWELAEQPIAWTNWANTASEAEEQARLERLVKAMAGLFGKKK